MSIAKKLLEIKIGISKWPKGSRKTNVIKTEKPKVKTLSLSEPDLFETTTFIVNVTFENNQYYGKAANGDYTEFINQAKLKYAFTRSGRIKGTINKDNTISWRVTK